MFCIPLSGSFVMQLVAVRVGALSKPGLEIGIGSISAPLPSPTRSSPSITTSWHGASLTRRGGTGLAMALSHLAAMSASGTPMPMR